MIGILRYRRRSVLECTAKGGYQWTIEGIRTAKVIASPLLDGLALFATVFRQ